MDFDKHSNICLSLQNKFGDNIILNDYKDEIQPFIEISPLEIVKVCTFLKNTEGLFFDFLNCISSIDLGKESTKLALVYHISSIVLEQSFIIRIVFSKASPSVLSVSEVWKTADWHEREAFDLMGINFENHQDLRRILLPADWVGHPLRKDYEEDMEYHGINIKYDR